MLSNSVSWFGLLDVTDCPPTADGEEPEQPSQSGGKAKRLPREVKQKLAKVARLAVSCIVLGMPLFLLQTCEDLCKIRVWY